MSYIHIKCDCDYGMSNYGICCACLRPPHLFEYKKSVVNKIFIMLLPCKCCIVLTFPFYVHYNENTCIYASNFLVHMHTQIQTLLLSFPLLFKLSIALRHHIKDNLPYEQGQCIIVANTFVTKLQMLTQNHQLLLLRA